MWNLRAAMFVLGSTALCAAALSCTSNQTQVRSMGRALEGAGVTEHSLLVPDAAARVLLNVELVVTAGRVSWVLSDPTGTHRETGESGPGETVMREHRYDPLAGLWSLQIRFEGMSGDYDFRLRAQW